MERIEGEKLSVYRTQSISLGISKNENRRGVKSKFAMVSAKDRGSLISAASTIPVFEEDLGTEAFEELMACRVLDAENKPKLDSYGGYIVSMPLLRQRIIERMKENSQFLLQGEVAEDPLHLDQILQFNGGMTMEYIFPDGPRYANDRTGKRSLTKDGQPVIVDRCSVFVQVKYVDDAGYHFYAGWELARRGMRMMNTFFKERAIVEGAKTVELETSDKSEGAGDPNTPPF